MAEADKPIPDADPDDISAIQAILGEQGLLGDGSQRSEEVQEDSDDATDEKEAKSDQETAPDDPEDAVADEIEAEAKGEEDGAGKGEEETREVSDDHPANAKSLASVARREALVQQREAQIAARERALAMGEDQARQRAHVAETTLQQWKRLALEDPGSLYEGLGEKDLVRIAAKIYYKQHPEAAPASYKEESKVAELQRRLDELQKRDQEREQIAAAQAREADQISYLTDEAKTLPDEFEYLKREAVEDPASTGREMFDRLNQLRSRRDPELLRASYVADPDERDKAILSVVAKSLNDEKRKVVERIKKVHVKDAKAPAPAVIPAEKKPGKKTISTKIATANTRPVVGASSHEDDIGKVINDFVTGKVPFGEG